MFERCPAAIASVLAVPSGSRSRFASTVTCRVRSRRLISAGEVARREGHQVGQRHERRPHRPRHRHLQVADLVHVAAQRLRQPDPHVHRLALLVLVGRDRLPADQQRRRCSPPPRCRARTPPPAPGSRRAGTPAGPAPSSPRCRRCPAPCTAPASARAAYFLSVAMSSPWIATDSGFWNESGSSRKFRTTPGIFSSRSRASCMNSLTDARALVLRHQLHEHHRVAHRVGVAGPDRRVGVPHLLELRQRLQHRLEAAAGLAESTSPARS